MLKYFFKDNSKKKDLVCEEGTYIKQYGTKISKELKVFYNPVMKLNRDISLLVIKTYFKDKVEKGGIVFCDPMVASGIREIRFLKTIPEMFKRLVLGDISKTAINNVKKNFKLNKVSHGKVELLNQNAVNTINSNYFDFIEVDPFGTPVPFLDVACQKIKHKGILSVTATDTAALCGTYPKTTLRKYGINIRMTHFYEELGLRNLIAYVRRQGVKYDKVLTPVIAYSQDHYYKIFFRAEESRTKAVQVIKDLKYISWDKKTQEVKILEVEEEGALGKTYVGSLNNKDFLSEVIGNLALIDDDKKINKLLNKLIDEKDIVGYYNVSKVQKENKFQSHMKFEKIISRLEEEGYEVSRPHNSGLGIKTNAPSDVFIKILKE